MNRKTKIKLSLSDRIFNAVNIFIMLVIAAVMLAPIIHVVCVSFSLGSEIQKGGLFLWPHGFTLEGYKKVLQDHMIVRSYINTVIYAFSHTALVIILTALTAYPLTIWMICRTTRAIWTRTPRARALCSLRKETSTAHTT